MSTRGVNKIYLDGDLHLHFILCAYLTLLLNGGEWLAPVPLDRLSRPQSQSDTVIREKSASAGNQEPWPSNLWPSHYTG
jgi:hypothetical protein